MAADLNKSLSNVIDTLEDMPRAMEDNEIPKLIKSLFYVKL
jgi:hypothetical protein